MSGLLGVVITPLNTLSQLFAGHVREQGPVTIASGAGVLLRGTVLGEVTASGQFVAFDPEATDGSETPRAILIEASVDATAADAVAEAGFFGAYLNRDLVWPVLTTEQTMAARTALRDRGIIIK